jgi:hypothetical protein
LALLKERTGSNEVSGSLRSCCTSLLHLVLTAQRDPISDDGRRAHANITAPELTA